ncbi:hypothetical protein LTR35_016505 [Friedmanniomyces endolithicus]|nr:hypothetical protein LTR35_016505 [Friedmanniomyces endolithicus]KAK0274034.1 hypothetical protein LTS00_015579 [Friedmanniomyces endolithicus]KAK0978200.1 hypothetical protein LTR54_016013 [Friedmanniomyces endolithicus]
MQAMHGLSIVLAVMAITSTGHAQNASTDGTTSAIVQGEITIHTVTVGKTPNAYDPPSVLAVPGDIISFEFWASNHSVIRSTYGERSLRRANEIAKLTSLPSGFPCIPYEDITGQSGFFSGFHSIVDGQVLAISHATEFLLAANMESDRQHHIASLGTLVGTPSLTHSTRLTHGIGSGTAEHLGAALVRNPGVYPRTRRTHSYPPTEGHAMVGVINPDSNTTLNTQIELSRQANYMLEPGQAVPQDALQSMSSLAATATTATVTVSVIGSAATATPTTSSTVTPTPIVSATPAASSSSSSLSPGAIAGIVLDGVVALVAVAALLLMYCRTNSSKAERRRLRDNSAPQMQSNGEMAGFMTAHNGNYDGAQLPPYQSPVMRHPEFKETADSRANEVPVGPNMREGPSFSFGQDRDADQHRSVELVVASIHRTVADGRYSFSNTSELSGLQSPQELPTMHEIFTPGTIYRNAASPLFS